MVDNFEGLVWSDGINVDDGLRLILEATSVCSIDAWNPTFVPNFHTAKASLLVNDFSSDFFKLHERYLGNIMTDSDTQLIMKTLLYLLRYSLNDYSGNHQDLDEQLETRISDIDRENEWKKGRRG